MKIKETNGYGVPAHWTGIETYERAQEIKRGLHRSGRFLRESVRVDLVDGDDGSITAVVTLFDKAVARAYIKDQGRWNRGSH